MSSLDSTSLGGLITSTSYGAATNVFDMAFCCGNGISNHGTLASTWSLDAGDGAGTVTVLADTPLLSAVQATGTRGNIGTGADHELEYNYEYTFYSFADRPEVWIRVLLTISQASEINASWSYPAKAIRPFMGYTYLDASILSFNGLDTASSNWIRWDGTSDGSEAVGVTWGKISSPTTYNVQYQYTGNPAILGYEANELFDAGSAVPYVATAGQRIDDNSQFFFMFHSSSDTDAGSRTDALIAGTSAAIGTAESN